MAPKSSRASFDARSAEPSAPFVRSASASRREGEASASLSWRVGKGGLLRIDFVLSSINDEGRACDGLAAHIAMRAPNAARGSHEWPAPRQSAGRAIEPIAATVQWARVDGEWRAKISWPASEQASDAAPRVNEASLCVVALGDADDPRALALTDLPARLGLRGGTYTLEPGNADLLLAALRSGLAPGSGFAARG